MKNWRTTLAGVAAIIMGIASIISHGQVSGEDVGNIFAGIGLLAAKDQNVTGGSVRQ